MSQNDPITDPTQRGIIAWFARNSVAANLLMVAIILLGLYSASTIRKQMFPLAETTWLNVSVMYRGAAPQEVEETITLKLEEALAQVQGLERVITRSNRGGATADLKVLDSFDPREVMEDVKSSIDAINSFPDGMERPVVRESKPRQEVMYIAVAADLPLKVLKQLGEEIHDEIRALPEVNISEYYSGSNYEISIEIDPNKLREYQLTLQNVASSVSQFSVSRSAGELRTEESIISVRVEDQAYVGAEFESIPIKINRDGSTIYLSDIATVKDGFEEGIQYFKLDGKNLLTIFIGASKDQSITEIAEIVHSYIDQRQASLPQGVTLDSWVDMTYYLNGRLNMMLSNMFYGGILVFIILSLFLRMQLAFWVMLGLPISFLGALAMMPLSMVDVTINVASLFAFILVLGVVVDDAIIIGENVYSEIEKHGQNISTVIRGAQRVAVPATFGVLTTIAAFLPMALESGPNAAFPHAIGYVVIFCLLFSLVESKLILPAHLAHMKPEKTDGRNPLVLIRRWVDKQLTHFIETRYRSFLERALVYRYTVFTIFTMVIMMTVALFASGNMKMVNMPNIPHDYVSITLEMNNESTEDNTLQSALKLEKMIQQVDAEIEKEFGTPIIERIYLEVTGRTNARVQAKLVDPEFRPMSSFELSARWRKVMPTLTGVKRLNIKDRLFSGGRNNGDLSFLLKSRDEAQLRAATEDFSIAMGEFSGVYDVSDSEEDSVKEARFTLKPLGQSLGLTTSALASQASFSLFGIEAQRIVRDRQEIRVMLRYPESKRDNLSALNEVIITAPNGAQLLLTEVANIELVESRQQIYREDGNRAVTVWASVNFDETQPIKVANHMRDTIIAELEARYPKVTIVESGSLKDERSDRLAQILGIFVILLPIYVLLALPLRSYTQPLMIMSVIPFGIVGAVIGHLVLGMTMSRMSTFGVFAVVGVVVNDSLVMVSFVNQMRKEGMAIVEAALLAGQRRFRAIVLTSLTTFFGLIPIIFESSLQAKIVIPMAVSLAFGVLFATVVTLILVPSLYVIMEDARRGFSRLRNKLSSGRETSESI